MIISIAIQKLNRMIEIHVISKQTYFQNDLEKLYGLYFV